MRSTGTAIAIGAAAALTGCSATAVTSTGDAPAPGPTAVSLSPVSHHDLAPAPSCDDLLEQYVDRALETVTAWGWQQPYYTFFDDLSLQRGALSAVPVAGEVADKRATSSATGTNVQEAGVDEPDVVKTDGSVLVRVQDGDLVVHDVTGEDPERVGSLALGPGRTELLLDGDRVVVLSGAQRTTRVRVVDLADPTAPELVDDATISAPLVTARQHGEAVRTVVSTELPRLGFQHPRRGRTNRDALAHNRALVRESTIEDWVPTVTRGDGDPELLLDCADVAIPSDEAGLGTLAVVGLDPADPGEWTSTGVVTSSRTAYFSTEEMYLATTPGPIWGCCLGRGLDTAAGDDGSTRVYAFDLDGTATAYAASGTVDGWVRDRWAMDAVDGVLRLAVGPSQRTGNFNSIVTMVREGSDLVEAGRLDGLGRNEAIRSVRWFDDLAYLVTFRQVDPLYAIDLTDSEDPELLGQLKIPGFSEYLHPLGEHRLLGMGQGGHGARASVFNITDPVRPRLLHDLDYGRGSYAGAGADPRQLTWLPASRTVLTVVERHRAGWVSVLTLDGRDIENRMVKVEYGDEVRDVRTVPLPDGRVLLVTGEDVSAFDL